MIEKREHSDFREPVYELQWRRRDDNLLVAILLLPLYFHDYASYSA